MVELEFEDGTRQRVERCFLFIGKPDPTSPVGYETAYVAQRKPGAPLRWYRDHEIKNVFHADDVEDDDTEPTDPGGGRRMALVQRKAA